MSKPVSYSTNQDIIEGMKGASEKCGCAARAYRVADAISHMSYMATHYFANDDLRKEKGLRDTMKFHVGSAAKRVNDLKEACGISIDFNMENMVKEIDSIDKDEIHYYVDIHRVINELEHDVITKLSSC